MANTIITKNSSTASAVPSAASLTQGELAVNVTDKKLYTKDASGTVVEITPTNAINATTTTGNAATATALKTARTIGGVSFDGTADINLPGVDIAGNQNTSGNAATATTLQTARTINGTSFNGSANITTATWGTSRTVSLTGAVTGSTSVNGSANVSIAATVQSGKTYCDTTTGSPAYYGARAWVNFNGSGAVAINSDVNVTSITDGGTGAYTITFTTAFPDANYAWSGSGQDTDTVGTPPIVVQSSGYTKSTTQLQIRTIVPTASNIDSPDVSVIVFR